MLQSRKTLCQPRADRGLKLLTYTLTLCTTDLRTLHMEFLYARLDEEAIRMAKDALEEAFKLGFTVASLRDCSGRVLWTGEAHGKESSGL